MWICAGVPAAEPRPTNCAVVIGILVDLCARSGIEMYIDLFYVEIVYKYVDRTCLTAVRSVWIFSPGRSRPVCFAKIHTRRIVPTGPNNAQAHVHTATKLAELEPELLRLVTATVLQVHSPIQSHTLGPADGGTIPQF